MAGATYHGKPLPCDEYAEVAQKRSRRGFDGQGRPDARRATIATATTGRCRRRSIRWPTPRAMCHGKIGKLFAETQMKHKFEKVGLPGLATRHSNHEILPPSDAMLGMESVAGSLPCQRQVLGRRSRGRDREEASQRHRQIDRRHQDRRADAFQGCRRGHGSERADFQFP